MAEFRAQTRGGKGLSGMSTKEEDVVTTLFVANTHTQLLFFTTDGMVYKLKTWRLPQGGRTAKGKAIVNILPIPTGTSIAAMMPVDAPEEDWQNLQIFFSTTDGGVRRNALSDFTNVKSNGKIAMKLPEGVQTGECPDLHRRRRRDAGHSAWPRDPFPHDRSAGLQGPRFHWRARHPAGQGRQRRLHVRDPAFRG